MHHCNREVTIKFKQMKMKHADEAIKNKDLEVKLQGVVDDNAKLKTLNEALQQ